MDRAGIQRNLSAGRTESSGSWDGAADGAAAAAAGGAGDGAAGGGADRPAGRAAGDRAFERSVAFWLRAYPRRWRALRAGEMTAVLADIAGPHAGRLDAAAAWGLLRGGWATRWREHPPLVVYVRYRLLDRRIPEQHREWARDDIDGRWYPVRRVVGALWFFWVYVLLGTVSLPAGLGLLEGAVAFGFMFPERFRSSPRRRHLALRADDRIVPGALVEGLVPRRRLAASGTLEPAALALTVVAVAGLVVTWGRPSMPLTIAVAGCVGLGTVPLVRHRLGRLMGHQAPQPDRALTTRTPRAWAAVAAAVIATPVVLAAALKDTAGLSDLLRALAGPVGVLAVLALPGVVAATGVVRTRRVDAAALSVSDVRIMALLGRLPAVDEAHRGLVPLDAIIAAGGMLAVEGRETTARLLNDRRPRRRLTARGALAAALVVVTGTAAASALAIVIGPTTVRWAGCPPDVDPGAVRCPAFVTAPLGTGRGVLVAVLVVATVLGLAGARLVRRRLARLVPLAPRQPHRVLVDVPEVVWLAVVLGTMAIVWEAGLEVTGTIGVVVSLALGPLALLVLPGLVVARRLVRDLPDAHGLAGSDVLAMAFRGRAPEVDHSERSPGPEPWTMPLGLASESTGIETTIPGTFHPRGLPS
ncbi:MAG: hypothetical protein ACOH17_13160 [Cellulomonas sp.]